jgi:hypothetical protein
MDDIKPQGFPVTGVTNGEEQEFAYADMEGDLLFAQNKDPKLIPGPGAIDPQDAQKLLDQMGAVMSFSYERIEDGEFDESLAGKDGMAIFYQMTTDGTVNNALQYLYGRMRSAAWTVEPASDDDQDIEVAAFVAEQLGIDDMRPNKYGFSRLFTLYKDSLIYGHAFGEIVLAPSADGGKVVLDKILPLNNFAIDEVKFDNEGGPKEIVLSGTVRGGTKNINQKKIPVWKLVVFLHDDDGSFQGKSLLRAAVAHWRVKRSMIVLINQGMERFLVGVPMVKVPKNVRPGTKQWSQAQAVARNFVSKPRTGVIVPVGYEFEVVKLNVSMPDARPYLEYHDAAIARAIGIDFNTIRQNTETQNINIGEFRDMTDNTVETLMKDFATTVNLYLIPKLTILNWPDLRRLPRLRYELRRGEPDFSASANLMGMIVNAALQAATQPPTKDPVTGASSGGGTDLQMVAEAITTITDALPQRFKKALGVSESELRERMNAYYTGASTGYKRDRRKPLP